jgi:hypothetical protein
LVSSCEFKDLELSRTARRVIWLAQRLPNRWMRVYMDNLFNSAKLYHALYTAEALAHGVVWTHGQGVPASIIQTKEKNKDRAEKLKGMTKSARLKHMPKCPDMLAVSTNDTKPVHILSTAAESVCVSCLSTGKSRPFDILRTIESCTSYLPHLTSLTHGIFSNWYWCLD